MCKGRFISTNRKWELRRNKKYCKKFILNATIIISNYITILKVSIDKLWAPGEEWLVNWCLPSILADSFTARIHENDSIKIQCVDSSRSYSIKQGPYITLLTPSLCKLIHFKYSYEKHVYRYNRQWNCWRHKNYWLQRLERPAIRIRIKESTYSYGHFSKHFFM